MDAKKRSILLAVLTASVVMGSATASWAGHRWGCWRYADRFIQFYNGGSGSYYTAFANETYFDSNSWHNYTDLELTRVDYPGTTDHVNCYSGYYGFNGWLGIAEILSYSGCTVRNGRARLNRSYMDSYSYTAKAHVACQEVGHLFGLDHQYATTCMNDTILNVPYPNTHDRDLINSIY